MYNKSIKSIEDVRDFFSYLMEAESLNFHPDTEFIDYVSIETGERTFNNQQAAHYQGLLTVTVK